MAVPDLLPGMKVIQQALPTKVIEIGLKGLRFTLQPLYFEVRHPTLN